MKRKSSSYRAGSREVAVLLACIAPLAQELQEKNPEIVRKWQNGATLDSLAREYNVASMLNGCSNPDDVAESIVRFSLVGMDGGSYVEGFPGLVSKEEYTRVSRSRSIDNIVKYNNSLDGEIGFANMSEEKLRALSRDAATQRLDYRGEPRVLIKEGEAELAYSLSLNKDYHNSKGVHWKKVVSEVNSQYHEGKPIRSIKSVRGMVYKAKVRESCKS